MSVFGVPCFTYMYSKVCVCFKGLPCAMYDHLNSILLKHRDHQSLLPYQMKSTLLGIVCCLLRRYCYNALSCFCHTLVLSLFAITYTLKRKPFSLFTRHVSMHFLPFAPSLICGTSRSTYDLLHLCVVNPLIRRVTILVIRLYYSLR